ncbi:sodium-coupled monocarboxylate transporter 1-like [Pieris napi]|uniref:sodium-coupled monocarboxylate transporter 1-like n=1 Tax=Pieris napi TaxID=78633 RepID=UPI001FBB2B9A|nr:sodium-coupled monocarboxylate transporter 1-like [Pieris napi]
MEMEYVSDMVTRMQKFSWVDYVVFVFMLAISAFVGVYWGFMKKQTTQNDYLLGGRNMKILPVSMSLVASFISGITLLGSPTEVYMYGTQYSYIIIGIFLMSVFMTQIYLPVFHELKMTSNYEYLSLRFDNKVRLFGSVLFVFAMIGWLPIVIYVPALAFNQVTGVNIHVITPIVCLVCIFYTSAGGLQAVVWTDVIQITVMLGAMALVAIKGTLDVGGFGVVWQRNMESGRIEAPNWDFNPTTRHTIWNLVIGGVIYWLQANSVNQTMVQRYLALPTLRAAKWSVCLFCIGISILYCFCLYCGLLIYARFYNCDPLQTKLAKAKDQLLPLLVMDVLGDLPGLPGVFLAGIFSAALSSLSTSLNSMSAVVLEDFYKPFYKRQLTDTQTNWLLRGVVVVTGVLCLALTFIVEKLGTILQLTMTLEAITMGPQLGVFTMGILMPWVDGLGALIGGLSGLVVMAWWCLSAQLAIASGHITRSHKPLSVDGCLYNYTLNANNMHVTESVQVNPVLHVSYMWYTLAGCLITMCVGMAVAGVNKALGKAYVPPAPKLLAPQIRGFFRDPPHPKEEPFINAYDSQKEKTQNSTSISMKPIKEIEEMSSNLTLT